MTRQPVTRHCVVDITLGFLAGALSVLAGMFFLAAILL